MRPPIVAAELWQEVMARAGDRCECRGACGSKHTTDRRTKGQQRCDRVNGRWISKYGEIRLVATPRDPVNEGDFVTAAQLPARRLIALCPPCHDKVRAVIRKAERQLPPQGEGLFDAELFRIDPASKKQADVGRA
jgi:hypothetical protein